MNQGEWMELVEQTDRRWPGGWTPRQAVAYYQDLREFEAVDVWAAWQSLNDSGREFPPNGSLLRSGAIESRRETAKREYWERPALPNPDGTVPWRVFAEPRYGRVSLWEAARIEHERSTDCVSSLCDIHTTRKAE